MKTAQTNGTLDNAGGAFSGTLETPFGYWGATPVTGVVSGFFANVTNDRRRKCISSGSLECEAENIVDNPDQLDSFGFDQFKTNTDRNVDYWGAGGEARFGRSVEPVPDSGGYLFRFAYIGIGGDVRGIDQDNRLRLKYVDADVLPGRTFEGNVNKTHISDSDAFEVRTTVRPNIALGGAPVQ